MGHLKPYMMMGNTPPGTCSMCAVTHDPAQPHDQQSLTYQYNFYDEHGRWPTWEDAMAHCPDDVKEAWIKGLAALGVDIKEKAAQ